MRINWIIIYIKTIVHVINSKRVFVQSIAFINAVRVLLRFLMKSVPHVLTTMSLRLMANAYSQPQPLPCLPLALSSIPSELSQRRASSSSSTTLSFISTTPPTTQASPTLFSDSSISSKTINGAFCPSILTIGFSNLTIRSLTSPLQMPNMWTLSISLRCFSKPPNKCIRFSSLSLSSLS